MKSLLEQNLELLKKFQTGVHNKVKAYLEGSYNAQEQSVERIALAQQDDLVVNMMISCGQKQHLLFDHEDPIGQAYEWIDKYIDPSNKAEIVFGMGFGFHIEVLLTSFKNKKVYIVEPNMELFCQILKVRNLALMIERASFLVDEKVDSILQVLNPLLWDTAKGGIQCEPFEVYSEMFADVWEELRAKFIKQAQSFQVDIATRQVSADIWIHNYIRNLNRIVEASEASRLAGKFKGKPGILVSAGPSLEKNIHLLKGMKDKCIIAAAGTAVNILERNEIHPHIMLGIDAWEGEARVHEKVKSQDIFFVYSNQVAEGSLQHFRGPKFLMNYSIDHYTEAFFEFAGIQSERIQSGPSVANTCFDLLYKMGCDPIILMGQDLCYSGGRNYAGEANGTQFENIEDPEKQGYILTKDIFDNEVYTTLGYIGMKNFFEGYFEKVQDKVEIINATEGGMNIAFARNDTLQNVIESHQFERWDILNTIRDIHEKSTFPERILGKLKDYEEFNLKEIQKLEESGGRQAQLVDAIKRNLYHPTKNRKAFDKMVKQIAGFTDTIMESPIYHSMLQNLIHMEFYLLKVELERATAQCRYYEEVKDIYIHTIERQNEILGEALKKVRGYLEILKTS